MRLEIRKDNRHPSACSRPGLPAFRRFTDYYADQMDAWRYERPWTAASNRASNACPGTNRHWSSPAALRA